MTETTGYVFKAKNPKLIKKVITDKRGRKTTKWVLPDEGAKQSTDPIPIVWPLDVYKRRVKTYVGGLVKDVLKDWDSLEGDAKAFYKEWGANITESAPAVTSAEVAANPSRFKPSAVERLRDDFERLEHLTNTAKDKAEIEKLATYFADSRIPRVKAALANVVGRLYSEKRAYDTEYLGKTPRAKNALEKKYIPFDADLSGDAVQEVLSLKSRGYSLYADRKDYVVLRNSEAPSSDPRRFIRIGKDGAWSTSSRDAISPDGSWKNPTGSGRYLNSLKSDSDLDLSKARNPKLISGPGRRSGQR